MFGCTTATRPASRSWSVSARHKPQPMGTVMASKINKLFCLHPRRARRSSTSDAMSPFTRASHSVTPRAPTISAKPTNSGKPVKDVPSPNHEDANVLGQCARNHSAAVQAMGSAIQSGARTVCRKWWSDQPIKAAKPTNIIIKPTNAGIASQVNQISAIRIQ